MKIFGHSPKSLELRNNDFSGGGSSTTIRFNIGRVTILSVVRPEKVSLLWAWLHRVVVPTKSTVASVMPEL